jgi:hypothetical protein
MNQQFGPLLYTMSVWALSAIIAITFHEAAHGFVASMIGPGAVVLRVIRCSAASYPLLG